MLDEQGMTLCSEKATVLRLAWLYYMDDLTQDVVAKRLGISRPSAGRILEMARRSGVVSVSLDARWLSTFEFSVELARVYGLEEVLVIHDAREPAQTQREVKLALASRERII